jgi:hypothetical protein
MRVDVREGWERTRRWKESCSGQDGVSLASILGKIDLLGKRDLLYREGRERSRRWKETCSGQYGEEQRASLTSELFLTLDAAQGLGCRVQGLGFKLLDWELPSSPTACVCCASSSKRGLGGI